MCKKIFALCLAAIMVCSLFALAGCKNGDDTATTTGAQKPDATGDSETVDYSDIKIGFIFLHDDKSTYDLNFMNAAKEVQQTLGLSDDQVIFKYPIDETSACYDAAADLADQGCNIVFADSFGHEAFMIQAAKEFPDVQFCHATGTKAHTEGLSNYHNAFASIYEGRFLAGIAAGMKLNEMIDAGTITAEQAVMGYVGAHPYEEVISGYTSFFLGARSVCPSVTMMVDFTGSWYSVDSERDVANSLMDKGAVLISQHADSMGAPSACEARNVPNVSYNGSTVESCPNTFIVSSKINWAPYFEYIINCVAKDETIATDWTGTLATGSVVLTEINEKAAAAGTKEAIEAATEKLEKGEIKVFATDTFTVSGANVTDNMTVDEEGHITAYKADVDDMGDRVPETDVVSDGYFHESEKRSAPYFYIDIDGITRLDK